MQRITRCTRSWRFLARLEFTVIALVFACSLSPHAEGACGDPATAIHDIQGSGLASPLVGQTVEVEGIVTGDFQNTIGDTPPGLGGFFVQTADAEWDADPLTSEGIFVYDNGFGVDVEPGERVRVAGTVAERFGQTAITLVTSVSVCSSGNPLSAASLTLPDDALAGDGLEYFEGMLVTFPGTLYVVEHYYLWRYGQVELAVEGRLDTPTNIAEPGAPALALTELYERLRITLDDGKGAQNVAPVPYLGPDGTLRAGDTVTGLTGVLDYDFGRFRIQPTEPVTFQRANERPAAPPDTGGALRVASMNVFNYFTTLNVRGANTVEEFARQRVKVIAALIAMDADILALIEIENNGTGPGSALADLCDGLNMVAGAGTYSVLDPGVSPIGTDAIMVAMLYRSAAVTPAGSTAILDSSVDPLFLDTQNRPSLAQAFEDNATGERFTVVVNHLRSRGSDCDALGDPDLGDGQGNCNVTRTNAVTALVNWLATDPVGSETGAVLVLGDMNAYLEEDPIKALEAGGLENLLTLTKLSAPYSYIFDGQAGLLDHAFASMELLPYVTGAGVWHINADEPVILDYNTEFGRPPELYSPAPYRSSDHDPVIVGLDFSFEPLIPGDINGDGKVDAVDVQLVINAALDIDIEGLDADVNGDSEVNAVDVQLVINAALA